MPTAETHGPGERRGWAHHVRPPPAERLGDPAARLREVVAYRTGHEALPTWDDPPDDPAWETRAD
jgi:hypothetical protein